MPSILPSALQLPRHVPLNERSAWSMQDASDAYGVSIRLIARLIADKKLPAARMGRRVVLDPKAVRAAVFGNSAPTA